MNKLLNIDVASRIGALEIARPYDADGTLESLAGPTGPGVLTARRPLGPCVSDDVLEAQAQSSLGPNTFHRPVGPCVGDGTLEALDGPNRGVPTARYPLGRCIDDGALEAQAQSSLGPNTIRRPVGQCVSEASPVTH